MSFTFRERTVRPRLLGLGYSWPDMDCLYFYRPRLSGARILLVRERPSPRPTSGWCTLFRQVARPDAQGGVWSDVDDSLSSTVTLCRLLAWLLDSVQVEFQVDGHAHHLDVSLDPERANVIRIDVFRTEVLAGIAAHVPQVSRLFPVALSFLRGEMPTPAFLDWLSEEMPRLMPRGGHPQDFITFPPAAVPPY